MRYARNAPFSARSISAALPLASNETRPLRVLSVHRRVINLEDDRGNLLAVVTSEVGDGPFHIVLEQPASFDFARPGLTGQWQGQQLMLGNRCIDWSQARRWQPHLAPATLPQRAISTLGDCVRSATVFQQRREGMDPATIARMQMGASLLTKGLLQADEPALRQGVSLLAGLGPGLTPAGDDYLLGALARLQLDAALPDITTLGQFIPAAALATTRLSRAWLTYAARGLFDARWHALQSALIGGEQKDICQAANDILSVGASSGPQAMAGFLLE